MEVAGESASKSTSECASASASKVASASSSSSKTDLRKNIATKLFPKHKKTNVALMKEKTHSMTALPQGFGVPSNQNLNYEDAYEFVSPNEKVEEQRNKQRGTKEKLCHQGILLPMDTDEEEYPKFDSNADKEKLRNAEQNFLGKIKPRIRHKTDKHQTENKKDADSVRESGPSYPQQGIDSDLVTRTNVNIQTKGKNAKAIVAREKKERDRLIITTNRFPKSEEHKRSMKGADAWYNSSDMFIEDTSGNTYDDPFHNKNTS